MPPSENCQRILILISKLLQNLANEILPGKKQPGTYVPLVTKARIAINYANNKR